MHAPYLINVCSPKPNVRYGSRKILQQTCDAAADVGAAAVIVHAGHAEDDIPEGPGRWLRSLEMLETDVRVLVENTAGGENAVARRFDALARLWDAIGDADTGVDLGFCFDTCHAHAAGEELSDAVERALAITGADRPRCTPTTPATRPAPAPIATRASARARSTPTRSAHDRAPRRERRAGRRRDARSARRPARRPRLRARGDRSVKAAIRPSCSLDTARMAADLDGIPEQAARAFNEWDVEGIVAMHPPASRDRVVRRLRGPDGWSVRGSRRHPSLYTDWFATFDMMHVEIEEILPAGERAVAMTRLTATAEGTDVVVEVPAIVYTFEDDTIFHAGFYYDRSEALQAAGLD